MHALQARIALVAESHSTRVVVSGEIMPCSSALFIMLKAMRSLTLREHGATSTLAFDIAVLRYHAEARYVKKSLQRRGLTAVSPAARLHQLELACNSGKTPLVDLV